MRRIVHNLRHAIRIVKSQPDFTALVVVALALGIGINCALFTVVNSLLLRPLPYRNADELVEISLPGRRPALEDLRRAQSLAGVAAFNPRGFSVVSSDGVRNVYGMRVSANLFELLGVDASVGRRFLPEEDQQPIVMLGYDYWRRVSGDPRIIGQTVSLTGEAYTIVGVLPADFTLQVRDGNLLVPYRLSEGRVVARLRSGASPAQAQVEVSGMVRALPQSVNADRTDRTQVIPI